MVERRSVEPKVVGSIPIYPATIQYLNLEKVT